MLYAIGEERRIVGISGFTVRPARARREKPRVSAFTSAKIDAILALKPDLAIGFSDLQADIAQSLIKRGVEVWISNHRTVDAILGYVCPVRRAGRRHKGRGSMPKLVAPRRTGARHRHAPAATAEVYSRNGTIRKSRPSAG